MTYTVRDLRPFYDAVIAQLETETGKNIGDGEAPTDRTLPYAVVHHLDEDIDPEQRGTLADPQLMGVIGFQVSSVGETRRSAQWMANEARLALCGWLPTVAGVSFNPVELEDGGPSPRDDDVQPPVFTTFDRYTVLAN